MKINNRCYDDCLLTNIVAIVRARASMVGGKLPASAGSRNMWARTGLLVAYPEPQPH